MNYYDAAKIRKKGFANLMTDKLASGQGVISSFRGAMSDRSKAKSLAMKERFDPMNIAKFLTGGSKLAPAIVGRLMGRSKADIGYFTGKRQYQYTPRQSSYYEKFNPSMGGGSRKATQVLEKIVSFMEKTREEDIKEQDTLDSFNELNEYMKADNHKEVVNVFKEAIKNKRRAMKGMAKASKKRQDQELARGKAEAPSVPSVSIPTPKPTTPAPATPPVKQAPPAQTAPPVKQEPPAQTAPAPVTPPVKPPTASTAPPAPAANPPTASTAPPVPARPPTAAPAPPVSIPPSAAIVGAVGAGTVGASIAASMSKKESAGNKPDSYFLANFVSDNKKDPNDKFDKSGDKVTLGSNKIVKGNIDITTGQPFTKSLTEMSMAEVIELAQRRSKFFDKSGAGAAMGKYQFMPLTLAEQAKKLFGPWALYQPFSEENQELLQQSLMRGNAKALMNTKLSITDANLYLMHFFGNTRQAGRVINGKDSDSMGDILGPAGSRANPSIAKMNVGQYKKYLANTFNMKEITYQQLIEGINLPTPTGRLEDYKKGLQESQKKSNELKSELKNTQSVGSIAAVTQNNIINKQTNTTVTSPQIEELNPRMRR